MFKVKLNSTLEALKLSDKANNGTLDKSDWKKIAAKYKEMHGSDMYGDIAAEQKKGEAQEEQHQAALAILSSVDGNSTQEDQNLEARATAVAAQNNDLKNKNSSLEKECDELKTKMKGITLADNPETVASLMPLHGKGHTDEYAFGIEHEMFSTKKRWNRVTVNPKYATLGDSTAEDEIAFKGEVISFGQRVCNRMNELFIAGKLHLNPKNGLDVDYSGLSGAGLGDQFVTFRTDEIIAQILMLQSVDALYPIRWGVQDRELITSAFFGEFSQGYQEGDVYKGDMELQPEVGHVDDAMFKTRFQSYKWIERTYLAEKNTSGSAAIKWGLIEWTVLNIVTKLYNEQYQRNILGIYVKPVKDVAGSALNSASGLVYTLIRYVHENKLLPLSDESYRSYDATGTMMLDAAKTFIADVKEKGIDIKGLGLCLELNDMHQDWWMENCRRKYGKDIDFGGTKSYLNIVPDTNVPIRWIPNMGNIKLMILQKPGNLMRLGFVPGEMTAIRFQEDMETVRSWSIWKEGFTASFVGKSFSTPEELEANDCQEQQIFINKPVIELANDAAEIDGKAGFWFLTGKNTASDVNITGIKNAQKGVAYVIECGDLENAPTVKKAGDFDGINADWTPTKVGDYIMVIKRKVSDSEFKIQELERRVNGVRTINKQLQPNIPGAR